MEPGDKGIVAAALWPPEGSIQRRPGKIGLLLCIYPDERRTTVPCDPEVVTMFSELAETIELPDGVDLSGAREYVGKHVGDCDFVDTYMGTGEWALSDSSLLPVELKGWPGDWEETQHPEGLDLLREWAYVISNDGWEALRASVVEEVGDFEP